MSKTKNPQVDSFLENAEQWQEELATLRMIVLDSELIEEVKWNQPCYTFDDNNVVILGGFKESCVLSFFKGALLEDPEEVLVKPGPNTRAARVIRFTNVAQIRKMEPVLKTYIDEAVEVEKQGLTVDFEENRLPDIPEELQRKFDEHPALKTAFDALTPGRQRGYLLYFSDAKQSKTRTSRVEKHMQRILDGKGLHDR